MKSKSLSIEELLNLSCPLNGFEFDENQMLALTKSNFKIIEGEYEADQDLRGKYAEIRDCVNKNSFKKDDYKSIIQKIAGINHTRTNGSNYGKLAELAFNYKLLNRVECGDIEIVDRIVDSMKGRKERSLVSKVCRYLETWKTCNANFTINDSILRAVLPYYCRRYKISTAPFRDDMSYSDYWKACNSLREQVKEEFEDMHQLDFLLWFFYGKDTIRFAIIKRLAKCKIAELSIF